MKKIVRLTENDLTILVKKVINEQGGMLPVDRGLSKITKLLDQANNITVFKMGVKILLNLQSEEYSEAVFDYYDTNPIPLPDRGDTEGRRGYTIYLFKSVTDKIAEDLF